MEQYKMMYAILCSGVSEALDAVPHLPENIYGRCLLEKALAEAEEIYLAEGESTEKQPHLEEADFV